MKLLFLISLLTASSAFAAPTQFSCDFWEDPQGIPHTRPTSEKNKTDGLACLGYLHGRYRAWQMDFFKKTVQGRKSEFLGKDSLQSDFIVRLIGLQDKADSLWNQMKVEDRKALEAYSSGVNSGFKKALSDGVYEFKKLGYVPEPWSPRDTLGLILLQSFDQSKRSFQVQLDEKGWTSTHAQEAASLFQHAGVPWDTTILKKGEYPLSIKNKSARANETASVSSSNSAQFPDFGSGVGAGSNNWVLSAKRSQSGNAWLANDPHLKLGYPPFWFWSHLTTQEFDVIGASFPGVPAIISGTNTHVSWGLTNAYLPNARVSYLAEEELKTAQTYRPWIWVRFWKFKLPFIFKTFRRTEKGYPILPLPTPGGKALVLRWSGFDLKPEDMMSLLDLLKVKDVQEADRVLSQVGIPNWNFVFADDQGKIGYRAIGRTPRFEKKPPFGVPVVSHSDLDSSSEFNQPLKPQEMPHVLNPARGYIASANNPQWANEAKWSVGEGQSAAFRAFRIEELLQKKTKHDLTSNQKIQCDIQAVDARFILPKLISILATEGGFTPADARTMTLDVFREWDFETRLDCRACGLYRRWVERIFSLQNLNSTSLYRKLSLPIDESFRTIVLNSLSLALDDLHFAARNQLPTWGQIHVVSFEHLGGARLSPTKPVPNLGDENTVNPGSGEWNGQVVQVQTGASHRLIIEMSKPPRVFSTLAGANSDQEFRDLLDPKQEWKKWLGCEYQKRIFPLDWTRVSGIQTIAFE